MKSTRLPRKLLLEIQGKSVLDHMIDRLKRSAKVSEIVLCTSTDSEDDELIEMTQANGVLSFRGSPEDVLERMLGAADHFGFDYLLSITADCPLVDPE